MSNEEIIARVQAEHRKIRYRDIMLSICGVLLFFLIWEALVMFKIVDSKKLCDVLESDVEEKYYLSAATMKRLQRNTEKEDFTVKGDTAHTVCSQSWKMTSFDNYIGG